MTSVINSFNPTVDRSALGLIPFRNEAFAKEGQCDLATMYSPITEESDRIGADLRTVLIRYFEPRNVREIIASYLCAPGLTATYCWKDKYHFTSLNSLNFVVNQPIVPLIATVPSTYVRNFMFLGINLIPQVFHRAIDIAVSRSILPAQLFKHYWTNPIRWHQFTDVRIKPEIQIAEVDSNESSKNHSSNDSGNKTLPSVQKQSDTVRTIHKKDETSEEPSGTFREIPLKVVIPKVTLRKAVSAKVESGNNTVKEIPFKESDAKMIASLWNDEPVQRGTSQNDSVFRDPIVEYPNKDLKEAVPDIDQPSAYWLRFVFFLIKSGAKVDNDAMAVFQKSTEHYKSVRIFIISKMCTQYMYKRKMITVKESTFYKKLIPENCPDYFKLKNLLEKIAAQQAKETAAK